MKIKNGAEKREDWKARVISSVFLLFLAFGFLAGVVKPEKAFSETENRYLQKKPEFTWSGLWDGSFGTKYETYLSDQFPGRDSWIGLKVKAERAQLKQDVNGVYFGKDRYLIEKFDREQIETGLLEENLVRAANFVNAMEMQLGKDHVRVLLLPSAAGIIRDQLPVLAAPYAQQAVEQKLGKMAARGISVDSDSVFKGREGEEIFYRTDHHWTALGAYYGYRAWAESLGLGAWEKDRFRIETVSRNFFGTVQSKVNVKTEADTIELFLPREAVSYEVFFDGTEEGMDGLYNRKALEGKDQYRVYLDGNHGLTEIRNRDLALETGQEGKKLLIIKDSFAHSFAPFAANHFETVYLLDLRYYNGTVSRFLEDYPVTDVLVLYQIPGFAKETALSKLR